MKTATLSSRRSPPRLSCGVTIDNATRKRLRIRSVLVPTDFSGPSLHAVKFAQQFAKRFGAKLHLVHVLEPDFSARPMSVVPLCESDFELASRVQRQLMDVAASSGIKLPRQDIHVLRGQAFEQIFELACKIHCDLIVIATRGNTGLKHLVLGSTAERVVRYSHCPVLIVRGPLGKTPASNGDSPTFAIGKILVPIDFSDCSMKGLDYAKALAREFRSSLSLVHAVHAQYYITNDEYVRYDFPLLMQQSERAARDQMRELVRKTDRDGLKVESILELGHPGQEICARAQDRHADLIVTSTHGITGLKHIFLGSTAEYVVRHAHCPVLVVPNHERAPINSTT